jgi:hypothetical protein
MRHPLWTLLVASTLTATAARAEVGFLLQPALEIGTPLQATTTASLSSQPSPSLRLGADFGRVALALDLSYSAFGLLGGGISPADRLQVGVDVEPVLWRGAEERAALYLIAAIGWAHEFQQGNVPSSPSLDGLGFRVGAGARYAIAPGFWAGAELGSKTNLFVGSPDDLFDTTAYVALVFTFSTR